MKKIVVLILIIIAMVGCINEEKSKKEIALNKIALNLTSASITVGKTIKLVANIEPLNATNNSVIWKSSNLEIATVDNNGTVTGRTSGTAVITVSSSAKNVENLCNIKVNDVKYEINLINTTGAPFLNVLIEDDGYLLNSYEKIVKLNQNGNKEWERPYYSMNVIKSDIGYIINEVEYMTLSKVGKDGDVLWRNKYSKKGETMCESVINSNDSGYILIGNEGTTSIAIKIDYYGNKLWEKNYREINRISSITEIKGEGYLILGRNSNEMGTTVALMKIDYDGKKIWDKSYSNAICKSIIQTKDGGFVVSGWSFGSVSGQLNRGEKDIYVLKIKSNGDTEWERLFGGNDNDAAEGVIQSNKDGYILVGSTMSTNIFNNEKNSGGQDIYILKVDEKGNKVYEKLYGTENNDIATNILSKNSEGYSILCLENKENDKRTYIIKIDENGEKLILE